MGMSTPVGGHMWQTGGPGAVPGGRTGHALRPGQDGDPAHWACPPSGPGIGHNPHMPARCSEKWACPPWLAARWGKRAGLARSQEVADLLRGHPAHWTGPPSGPGIGHNPHMPARCSEKWACPPRLAAICGKRADLARRSRRPGGLRRSRELADLARSQEVADLLRSQDLPGQPLGLELVGGDDRTAEEPGVGDDPAQFGHGPRSAHVPVRHGVAVGAQRDEVGEGI